MTTPLKLYLDTHISKDVAEQLQKKGIDVIHCDEVGMSEADDPDHLEYATKEGRAVVSHDKHFSDHHYEWLEQGKSHAGIFWVSSYFKGNTGAIVNALLEFNELIEGAGDVEKDVYNRLHRIERT